MNFEDILKKIISDNFLLQDEDTPYLNEQTVQFKIAIELYKRLGIEVQLEKCFNPSDKKKDYLDIFYAEEKIGIELKYKLKAFDGFPFKNQGAQDLGTYGFFIDIHRLENWVFDNKIKTGFAVFITNDSTYKEERSGRVHAFSLIAKNKIITGKEYTTYKGKNQEYPLIFKQNYKGFDWQSKEPKNLSCNFFVCIVRVERPIS